MAATAPRGPDPSLCWAEEPLIMQLLPPNSVFILTKKYLGGHRMKRIGSLLFVILIIIVGCGKEPEMNAVTSIEQESAGQQNKMPKEMPGTFDFMVRFGYGTVNKNEINTFQDTVTKDLIMNGTATAQITLSKEEMRSIYIKMREINIMGEKELGAANQTCERVPYSEDIWEVNINGETKTLTWTDRYCAQTSDMEQLLELRDFVEQIVKTKEEYKKLPESEGGYE